MRHALPNQIFFATNNPGKLNEARRILKKFRIKVISPKDLGLALNPEETGETYYQNARLKAEVFRSIVEPELLVIGDDSGLEIPALNNEPGLHSRRWRDGKVAMSDQEIFEFCLERMKELKGDDREARFVNTLVAVDAKGKEIVATGYLRGKIVEKPVPNVPAIKGYPFRALFQEFSTGKFLHELEDGEAPTHRQQAFEKLFSSL